MSQVTRIISEIEQGNAGAAEALLPLIYDELRKLAAAKLAQEPGQTLQATALVHEAYLRLIGGAASQHWDGRGHFFGAAAEAMRRILIEQARRRHSQRRGGGRQRVALDDVDVAAPEPAFDVLALNDALERFEKLDSLSPIGEAPVFCRTYHPTSRSGPRRLGHDRGPLLVLCPRLAARGVEGCRCV